MEKTTIQVSADTLNRLKMLKRFDRESYDELLNYLMNQFNEEVLSNEEISEIQAALESVRTEGTVSFDEVLKEADISL